MRKVLIAAALIALAACTPKSEEDRFVDELMSRMTTREKLGQTNHPAVPSEIITGNEKCEGVLESIRKGEVGAILNSPGLEANMEYQRLAVEESRLGIPLLIGYDVIHGHKTVFPIPLGLAATWDPGIVEGAARICAEEASADGINWTYNPMVDIARDPRWGRCAEGSGEDPFLSSALAAAYVRGYQGKLESDSEILACVKHFAIYGASESGRDYRETDMSPHRMYNDYFPPYKAAVDAGVASVMSSFNDINGMPATANKWLLTNVLRDEWGFDGFIVSDYNSVGELSRHGLGDSGQVSVAALDAGLDMDMVTAGLLKYGEKALADGKISMKQVDRACRRILKAKYRLGLFADPYKFLEKSRPSERQFTPEHRAAAKVAAEQSFVLLKNSGILPLEEVGTIALVGPLADAGNQYPGCWTSAASRSHPSLLDAFRAEKGLNVLFARGSNAIEDEDLEKSISGDYPYPRDSRPADVLIKEAVAAAEKADVVIAAVGELAYASGESASATSLDIPECQKKLLRALKESGKPVVMVLFNGRPMSITEEDGSMDAILDVWFGGSEAGEAIRDVLLGRSNPSGKITMTFPRNVGQVPIYYGMKKVAREAPAGHGFWRYNSNWTDSPTDPLYPFGYGLSYTSFEYENPVLSSASMAKDGSVTLSVTVRNSGSRDGAETVQVYIHDIRTEGYTRPVKELKAFRKVFLKAGESRIVEFEITPDMLSWYDVDQYNLRGSSKPLHAEKSLQSGDFEILVGPNSRDTLEPLLLELI